MKLEFPGNKNYRQDISNSTNIYYRREVYCICFLSMVDGSSIQTRFPHPGPTSNGHCFNLSVLLISRF